MAIDEFTDTYSDDIIYLREARIALLTHPLRAAIPTLCNASFCRLFAIVMIGSIEAMLERWRDRDNLNILDAYFAAEVSNGDRVKSLRNTFVTNGINVNSGVFDDYLAIKYLRNAIVHASWQSQSGQVKQEQIDWIEARGFPTDTRNFSEQHWQRIEWVNENMIFYIAITGIAGIRPPPDHCNVGMPVRPLPDTAGILSRSDWPRLYWSNLDRISDLIGQRIETAALKPEYYWAKNSTDDQIEALPHVEQKRQFYMAASVAAQGGFEPLTSLASHADNAASCWREYIRLVPEFKDLALPVLHDVLQSLRVIHEKHIFPKNGVFPPWPDDTPHQIRHQLVIHSFESIEPLTVKQVADTHHFGAKAKRAIANIMPLLLFSIQLPIIARSRIAEWRETASYVADVFEVGQSWYAFLEGHPSPREPIDFYREMIGKLAAGG